MLQYTQIDCAYTVKYDTICFDFQSLPLVKGMKRLQEKYFYRNILAGGMPKGSVIIRSQVFWLSNE